MDRDVLGVFIALSRAKDEAEQIASERHNLHPRWRRVRSDLWIYVDESAESPFFDRTGIVLARIERRPLNIER